MYCIIPLAGPDFVTEAHGVKPLMKYKGSSLIEYILKSRPWFKDIEELIFVLRDIPESNHFLDEMKAIFGDFKYVKISDLTRGALLSASAAISLVTDFDKPLVVDLIDIDYQADVWNPMDELKGDIDGLIPYFISDDPAYSYLVTDECDTILRCAEKKVISDKASAGTYFFRNVKVFTSSIPGSMENQDLYSYRNNLFLCPCYNALIEKKNKIVAHEVQLLKSVSKDFK